MTPSPPTPRPGESELRRRAAWVLGMLGLVAVLFVVLLVVFLRGSGGGGSNAGTKPGPLDSEIAEPSGAGQSGQEPSSQSSDHPAASSTKPSSSPASSTTSASHAPGAGSASSGAAHASCPTDQPCVLDGDVGDAAVAIDAYRSKHGRSSVPVTVSKKAQNCAKNEGNGCSGHWSETQYGSADGAAVVKKITRLAELSDPAINSIGIGWAWDPGANQFFFSIVRHL